MLTFHIQFGNIHLNFMNGLVKSKEPTSESWATFINHQMFGTLEFSTRLYRVEQSSSTLTSSSRRLGWCFQTP